MPIELQSQAATYSEYLPARPADTPKKTSAKTLPAESLPANDDIASAIAAVGRRVEAQGFVFLPWQLAAFITAVRTKPFVILAGISGTGKTKLPRLVAEATEASYVAEPVRPDWNDSGDLLGYTKLDGTFLPGPLLKAAKTAQDNPGRQHFFLLDEMNIARVEYYLAEVLSRLEDRFVDPDGVLVSQPLLPGAGTTSIDSVAFDWSTVVLPMNLCLVGSVNMDETTYGFSRKVLDRAFVIEFSTIDLESVGTAMEVVPPSANWHADAWAPRAITLASHPEAHGELVDRVITALTDVNKILERAQLQVGYRVRDEVALFCLAALDADEGFADADQGKVDPLDLAIAMKVLPRIQGSSASISTVLDDLETWATPREVAGDSGTSDLRSGFTMCADRIRLMKNRLTDTGFTSYWL
jgi:hypothetical protein